jgi:hypothetical protein
LGGGRIKNPLVALDTIIEISLYEILMMVATTQTILDRNAATRATTTAFKHDQDATLSPCCVSFAQDQENMIPMACMDELSIMLQVLLSVSRRPRQQPRAHSKLVKSTPPCPPAGYLEVLHELSKQKAKN